MLHKSRVLGLKHWIFGVAICNTKGAGTAGVPRIVHVTLKPKLSRLLRSEQVFLDMGEYGSWLGFIAYEVYNQEALIKSFNNVRSKKSTMFQPSFDIILFKLLLMVPLKIISVKNIQIRHIQTDLNKKSDRISVK